MKTSHIVLISATLASSVVIGVNYAPTTTIDLMLASALTALLSLIIYCSQLLKNEN